MKWTVFLARALPGTPKSVISIADLPDPTNCFSNVWSKKKSRFRSLSDVSERSNSNLSPTVTLIGGLIAWYIINNYVINKDED